MAGDLFANEITGIVYFRLPDLGDLTRMWAGEMISKLPFVSTNFMLEFIQSGAKTFNRVDNDPCIECLTHERLSLIANYREITSKNRIA